MKTVRRFLPFLLTAALAGAQDIGRPKEELGFNIGDDCQVANDSQLDVVRQPLGFGVAAADGATAAAEATVGEGKVVLLGPEVTFRGQSYGTFKLLFNGLYYGSAKPASLN